MPRKNTQVKLLTEKTLCIAIPFQQYNTLSTTALNEHLRFLLLSFENMKGKNIVIEIDNFDVIKDKEIQGCIIRCSNDEGNYIVGCRMPDDSNEIKDYVNKNYSE